MQFPDSFKETMTSMYLIYAQGIFDDPDEELTAKDVSEAVEVGKQLGLDFWNPEHVESSRYERDRLRKQIGATGKDIEDV